MNQAETSLILVQIISLDPRWSTSDQALMQQRVNSWAAVLADVPVGFARDFTTRYYGKPDVGQITPAAILTAWRTAQRVVVSRDREPMLIGDTRLRAPEGFTGMVAASTARWTLARQTHGEAWKVARAEARETDAQMPVPWPVHRLDDVRERRCTHHDICICTHTECRDGWLEVESNGRVKRCPVCEEAVAMRSELAPKRGRR